MADAETPEEVEETVEEIVSDVEKLEAELKEYKDKYFRALAEIENTRKRLQKEKLESQSFAIQNVILDFLQPMDHFEHALKASKGANDEIRQWAIGFEMILTQLKQVLENNDVLPFESKGKVFDPHLHDAIETEEVEENDGIVLEEFLKGYKMGNRIIRPARVKVAVVPQNNNNNEEES